MYQHLFSQFWRHHPDAQFYTAHSHHFWPDCTRQAVLDYWDDAARLVDGKWDRLFAEKLPALQQAIARIIGVNAPEQIVFAPNTHELLYRLLTALDGDGPLRILSSDGEFHSFERQTRRLEEEGLVEVTRVATEPYATLHSRLLSELASRDWDLLFISQVFFDSGVVLPDWLALARAAKRQQCWMVLDGYHGFMAIPTDLSAAPDNLFYLSGGYKYAMAGEGGCFMVVPPNCGLRPRYTGWFAGFEQLSRGGTLRYPDNGMRFAGSTMDFTPLYRLAAVLDMLDKEQIRVEAIHAWVQQLQRAFLEHLEQLPQNKLTRSQLLQADPDNHGHFLAFRLDSPEHTAAVHDWLRQHRIYTDWRRDRLRFGFGLYQSVPQIDLSCLSAL